MNREFAAEVVPSTGCFDGIDVADQIGDGDVRCRQFLHVAFVRGEIGNGGGISAFRNQLPAAAANRRVRIVVDLAARDVWHLGIKQGGHGAEHATFRLSAQSEQYEMVARKNGVDHLRYHRVVIAHDAGENGTVLAQSCHQIVAQFVLNVPGTQDRFREGTSTQFAECARKTHDEEPPEKTAALSELYPASPRSLRRCWASDRRQRGSERALARLRTPQKLPRSSGRVHPPWPLPPAFCRKYTVRRRLGRMASK